MGVAGCMLSCSEVWIKDIGVMGTPKGWKILVGGNSGMRPRIGDVLVEDIATDDEVLSIIAKIIDFYKSCGKKERICRIVEQMGIEEFKKVVLG
jgi:NAD(P)H-nitrite reductase large subunit